jgi:hypothetical protein
MDDREASLVKAVSGGYCFSMGSGSVSWSSRKQRMVADSSCYAEYIALRKAAREAILLQMVLEGTKFLEQSASPIFCNNDAAIKLAEDQVWHSKCKHIRVKHHFVRDQVLLNEIKVNRVRTNDNLADIFTKALGQTDFLRHRQNLGLVTPAIEEESSVQQG